MAVSFAPANYSNLSFTLYIAALGVYLPAVFANNFIIHSLTAIPGSSLFQPFFSSWAIRDSSVFVYWIISS